jgi:hypothetical protein
MKANQQLSQTHIKGARDSPVPINKKALTFEDKLESSPMKRSRTQTTAEKRRRSVLIQEKLSKQIFNKLMDANNVIAKEEIQFAILNRNNSIRQQRDLSEIQEDISLWGEFYADAIPSSERPKFLIAFNARWKIIWDMAVALCIVAVTIIYPLHIAFEAQFMGYWFWSLLIDAVFLVDIVFTFFTTYQSESEGAEVVDQKKIIKRYLMGWFSLDMVSILPFDYFYPQAPDSSSSSNHLLRLFRIGKLVKLLRLIRMLKTLRLMKKQLFISDLSERLKINTGSQRLISFCFYFLLFAHVFACFFIVTGTITSD